MAMAEGLPPVSPRLRSVLSEHFSLTMHALRAQRARHPRRRRHRHAGRCLRGRHAGRAAFLPGRVARLGEGSGAAQRPRAFGGPARSLPPSEAMVVDAPPLLGLAALELSEELAELALAAGLPPASPRLRSVLSEHFSLAIRCASAQRPRAKLASSALYARRAPCARGPLRTTIEAPLWPDGQTRFMVHGQTPVLAMDECLPF